MKEVSVATIVAEIEVSYKPGIKISTRPILKNSHDVYRIFIDTWDKSKIELVEQFKVMLLNRNNRVLGICTLTSGSVTNTIVDPKQVFAVALKTNAVQIIMAHNHPSGNTKPSNSDEELTNRIKLGGQILDIKVLDHLIVTAEGYYSFADEGAM